VLVASEEEAIAWGKSYLSYMPQNWQGTPAAAESRPAKADAATLADVVVPDENKAFDMRKVLDAVVDAGSLLEVKPRFAKELITAFARIEGKVVGVVANQPKYLGGVLFVDSADKAARFIWLCDAFNVPLLFLADVPGFMIGTKVEKQGIIRAGAKMIAAVSEATVPKISVIVRKAYGAGLYAMCGPAFDPDACLALPTASIAVMGAQAAVNAVFYNRIQEKAEGPERDAFVEELRREYREDVDLGKLASELVVDAVLPFEALRRELGQRFLHAAGRSGRVARKHLVPPM
jgi:acetyl-CoA carboxylase carboxyltransferase component